MSYNRFPDDPIKQLWWCRGMEYKFSKLDIDKGIAIVEHHKFGAKKICKFKTRTGYMLNSSYQCPKCDETAQENALEKVEEILQQLSSEKKGSYIKSKKYKDNKIFVYKYKGKTVLFTYLDKRYFTNILYPNTYHDVYSKPLARKYSNVVFLTHLDYTKLRSVIIKSLKEIGRK